MKENTRVGGVGEEGQTEEEDWLQTPLMRGADRQRKGGDAALLCRVQLPNPP